MVKSRARCQQNLAAKFRTPTAWAHHDILASCSLRFATLNPKPLNPISLKPKPLNPQSFKREFGVLGSGLGSRCSQDDSS